MALTQPKTVRQLVEAIKQGDDDGFRELYDRYKDPLFKTSLALCLNRQDAEDTLQESFMKMHQKIHTLRDPDRLVQWMYRIVVNTSKSKIISENKKWNELEKSNEIPADSGDLGSWNELGRALHQLPAGYRNVFVLHAIQEIPQEAVAHILGISIGTVKSQYHRARQKLQSILKEMGITFEEI